MYAHSFAAEPSHPGCKRKGIEPSPLRNMMLQEMAMSTFRRWNDILDDIVLQQYANTVKADV
jgi:hypothetical protein